jgi:hypothetical protein
LDLGAVSFPEDFFIAGSSFSRMVFGDVQLKRCAAESFWVRTASSRPGVQSTGRPVDAARRARAELPRGWRPRSLALAGEIFGAATGPSNESRLCSPIGRFGSLEIRQRPAAI